MIALPFDAAKLYLDRRTAIKSFYSNEIRLPFERISLVSKGEIRNLVSKSLELLHHWRGLPFAHLWHYPDGAKSVFCFRIDADRGTDEQMDKLYKVVRKNRIPATWFADVKSHEKSLHLYYSGLRDQEIGVHCYEHKTFRDYKKNLLNIQNAQRRLEAVKIKAVGFAAPYGEWNEELERAVSDCGFEYSSEFSYDYDNLPGLPGTIEGNCTLQIPVHPICIGSLKRHGYNDRQMIKYFKTVIDKKLESDDPVIFYHHPGDEHCDVLNNIFRIIINKKLMIITMSGWARWWKKRQSLIPKFKYQKDRLYLQGIRPDRSLFVHITRPDDTHALVRASAKIDLGKIGWRRKPREWRMPDDYLRIRWFNYRIPLVRIADAAANLVVYRKRK